MLGPAPDAAALFQRLQLTADAPAADAGPRLFGVLLYTDAHVELATYVRTHLDDLNALSGPATRIFVVEKQRGPDAVKRYWRRHLEAEVYRVLAPLRWWIGSRTTPRGSMRPRPASVSTPP
ncbi:hypothetical protein ACWCQM_27855 [Streptomyces sp. NPDC002125]